MKSFIEVAKSIPFFSPFHTAKCSGSEQPALPKPTLVPTRSIAAAATAEGYSCEFGSMKYYALCAVGGALSCGVTHTAVVPLDLVKCRIQVDPAKYKSIVNGFKVTLKKDDEEEEEDGNNNGLAMG